MKTREPELRYPLDLMASALRMMARHTQGDVARVRAVSEDLTLAQDAPSFRAELNRRGSEDPWTGSRAQRGMK